MIDQLTIDRIFASADIVEVVKDFVSLRKNGVNYQGLCPFHNEKTPSFVVSPSKGIYKCFGCSKGGNPVNFIMEHEQMTYVEALKYLARKYNIEIQERELTPDDIKQRNERESLMVVTAWAQGYFTTNLHKHSEGKAIGLSYFKERGFRSATIDKFQLGYCLEQRGEFTQAAIREGYKIEYLVKAGLTIEKEGNKPFDRFQGRVIFPIHSVSGRVIGFGGRTMSAEKKIAKYLNSPESEIYHKSQVLYGLYFAKKAITQEDKCLLVEGYTDVISLHQAGIENVVASSGTALSPDQIRLIKRFTPNITVLYDGDSAGIKASLRGIDLILEEGLNVRVVLLPEGEDPDSYAKAHSASEVLEYIKANEMDFIHFKAKLLLDDAQNDPIKKANLITDIVRTIAVIPSTIIRSVYIKECTKILDVEEAVLYSEVAAHRRKQGAKLLGKPTPPTTEEPKPKTPPLPSFVREIVCEEQEKEIIYLLLKYGHIEFYQLEPTTDNEEPVSVTVGQYIVNELLSDDLELQNLRYRKLLSEYQRHTEESKATNSRTFLNHHDADISQIATDLLFSQHKLSNIWKKHQSLPIDEDEHLHITVPKAILVYKSKVMAIAVAKLNDELKGLGPKSSTDDTMRILQRITALNEVKSQLSKQLDRIVL